MGASWLNIIIIIIIIIIIVFIIIIIILLLLLLLLLLSPYTVFSEPFYHLSLFGVTKIIKINKKGVPYLQNKD